MKRFFLELLCSIIGISSAFSRICINEVMQSNINGIMDDHNEFPDSWVEVYNDDTLAFDFTEYSISPSKDFTESYPLMNSTVIPAKGYLLFYCDKEEYGGMHADFRLDPDGQTLYLFDPVGHVVDSLVVPEMLAPNIAYGRVTDGADSLSWFKTATPASANTGFHTDLILKKPKFSIKGGLYDHPVSLHLSLQGDYPADAVVRYTTNGSEPTEDSPIAPDTIYIDHTMAIRAKTFSDSALSKMSATHTFIVKNREYTLPIVSIVTDSAYMYDDELGILVDGTYGQTHPDVESDIPSFGNMNFLFSWRRPINVEYFDWQKNNTASINQMCEIELGGNTSVMFDIKSFNLKTNKRFGENKFTYPFWQDKPNLNKTKCIYLRNSGQDYNCIHFRDAMNQMSFGQNVDVDWAACQPVVVLINGSYYGLLNLREKVNADYVWSNYDKLENIDMLSENNAATKAGDLVEYYRYRHYLTDSLTTLSQLDSLVDMDEFLNYFILSVVYCNKDFPGNNQILWRERSEKAKWRFILKDTDITVGICFNSVWDLPYFNYILRKEPFSEESGNNEYGCKVFMKAMSFPKIVNQVIDRLSVYMGTFVSAESCEHRLDSMANVIASEIPYYYDRIGRNTKDWEYWKKQYKDYMYKRIPFLYNNMHEFFGLNDTVSLQIKPYKKGQLFFNGVKINKNRFDGSYFYNRPLYLSQCDSAFSYLGDSIVISKSDSTRSAVDGHWYVLYNRSDSSMAEKFDSSIVEKYDGKSLFYTLPKEARRVLITDSLFIEAPACNSLPDATVQLKTADYFVPSSEVKIKAPIGYNPFGDTLYGKRIDNVDSLLIGENTLQWQFTDGFGDTLVCQQKVFVHDSVPPVLGSVAMTPLVLYLDSAHCSIDSALIRQFSPVAWDNSRTNIKGVVMDSLEVYSQGSYELEWKFTDAASNSLVANQSLLVIDTIKPVYDSCGTMPVLHFAVRDNRCRISSKEIAFVVPIANDNCGVVSGELSVPDSLPIGQNTATWKFVDESGNTLTCSQQIEVADGFAPYYDRCDSMPVAELTLTDNSCGIALTETTLETPVAEDNCGNLVLGKHDSSQVAVLGENVVDWNFVDDAGNSVVCRQTVLVKDVFAPVIDCSSLSTLSFDLLDNSRGLPFDSVQIDIPYAADNCGQFVQGQMETVDTLYLGTNVVNWIFEDAAGNSSWCPQIVVVLDKCAPEYLDCNSMPTLTADITDHFCQYPTSSVPFVIPLADDNVCKVDGELVATDSLPIGTSVVYWMFTDASGNSLTCQQMVEIKDACAPITECEKIEPIVADLYNNSCGFPLDSIKFEEPYATDNCGVNIVGQLSGVPDVFTIGSNEVTWLFTDDAGNASSCPQTVFVMDKMPPVVDCAAIDTLTIDLALNANDVVKEAVSVPLQYAVDNCDNQIAGSLLAEDVYRIGTNVAWWNFMDAYGNMTLCPQIVVANKHFKVEVYPNPTCDYIYVAGTEVGECMKLMNAAGQLLKKVYSTGNPMLINLQNYSDGVYLLMVKDHIYKVLKKE